MLGSVCTGQIMNNTVYLVLFKSFQTEYMLKLLFLEQQLKIKQQQKTTTC